MADWPDRQSAVKYMDTEMPRVAGNQYLLTGPTAPEAGGGGGGGAAAGGGPPSGIMIMAGGGRGSRV